MESRPIRSLKPLKTTQFTFSAHPAYAWFTIVVMWMLSLLPWRSWAGTPDLLLLLLAFWYAHGTPRVSMLTGFAFGLLMDVQDTNLLGEHALTYVLVMGGMSFLRKRMLQFNIVGQIFHVLPLFVLATIPSHLLAAWLQGTYWSNWDWLWSGVLMTIAWFPINLILRLPFGLSRDGDDAIL